jgi:hypothetical protein
MKDGSAGSPNETCDAISVGLGFVAQKVTLGAIAPPEVPSNPCQ